jgi:hypothetical protein
MSHDSQLAMTIFVEKSRNLAHFSENEKHEKKILFQDCFVILKIKIIKLATCRPSRLLSCHLPLVATVFVRKCYIAHT